LIAEEGEVLPFDTAQMRTIFFNHADLLSAAACKKEVVSQLQKALQGNFDSPIATAIDLRSLRSGDVLERTMAALVQQTAAITKEVRDAHREVRRLGRESAGDAHEPLVLRAIQGMRSSVDEAIKAARRFNLTELATTLDKAREPISGLTAIKGQLYDEPDIEARVEMASYALTELESILLTAMRAAPPGTPDLDSALSSAEMTLSVLMDFVGLDYDRHWIDSVRKS
jgi:hypothetical protein